MANSSMASGARTVVVSAERNVTLAPGKRFRFRPKRRSQPPGVAASVSSPCIHQIFGALRMDGSEDSWPSLMRNRTIPSPISAGRANFKVEDFCWRTSADCQSVGFPFLEKETSTLAFSPKQSPRTTTLSPARTGSEAQMTTGLATTGRVPAQRMMVMARSAFVTMNLFGTERLEGPPCCRGWLRLGLE